MIKKVGSMWYLYTSTGKKILGKFKTKKEALERERQVIYFKNKK